VDPNLNQEIVMIEEEAARTEKEKDHQETETRAEGIDQETVIIEAIEKREMEEEMKEDTDPNLLNQGISQMTDQETEIRIEMKQRIVINPDQKREEEIEEMAPETDPSPSQERTLRG